MYNGDRLSLNTRKANFGSGIEEEFVENSGDFQELIKSFVCVICLDIVKIPVQCEKCESLYCAECWDILKTAGKPCVYNCNASCIKNANKFVLELLRNLFLRCNLCGRSGIDYHTYIKHIEGCQINIKFSNKEEIDKEVLERDRKIEALKLELKTIKDKNALKSKEADELKKAQLQSQNTSNNPYMNKLRQDFITHKLNTNQKMDLYRATIEGRLIDLKNLVLNNGYSILEEVSAANYYWTPLHYAMHYGQMEIVLFCFDVLKKMNILDQAIKIESNDGRCPILCLLRSNSLDINKKKEFMERLLKTYKFKVSDTAKAEMKKRGMENLISTYGC